MYEYETKGDRQVSKNATINNVYTIHKQQWIKFSRRRRREHTVLDENPMETFLKIYFFIVRSQKTNTISEEIFNLLRNFILYILFDVLMKKINSTKKYCYKIITKKQKYLF